MLNPIAESKANEFSSLSDRIGEIEGKCIGFHTNAKEAAKPVAEIISEKLLDRYDEIEFSYCDVRARNKSGLEQIANWAKERTDACITSVGDCGGCTRAVVRATNEIEEAGVPAVGLVAEGFETSWEANAYDQRRQLRYQSLPIRSETTDFEELRERITEKEIQGVQSALTEPLSDEEKGSVSRNFLS